MGVGVVAHVYLKVNSPFPNWPIFMTNQVRTRIKLHVWTFPGNGLAGYLLHPTSLAGPLGKVQVVIGQLLPGFTNRETSMLSSSLLIPGVQSRMAEHSLSSLSSPGLLR